MWGSYAHFVSQVHTIWGYIAAGISGAVGVWGVLLRARDQAPRMFIYGVGIAVAALLAQVVLGLILLNSGSDPGNQHVFYGVLIAVTFSLAYIYRAQFRKRPTYYLGLLMLFTMGLAIRGILTVGVDF